MNVIDKNTIILEGIESGNDPVVISNRGSMDFEFALTREEKLEGLLNKIDEIGFKESRESVERFYNLAHDHNVGSCSTKILKEVVRLESNDIKLGILFWNGTIKEMNLESPSVGIYCEKEKLAEVNANIKVNLKPGEVSLIQIEGKLEKESQDENIWAGFLM